MSAVRRSSFIIVWVLLAFALRLRLATFSYFYLPQVGYESKTQQAGYLFFDAFHRDTQAWDLAQSGKPLAKAFDQKFSSDQYGGLLWMSAFVYRYLSGTTHQPLLIVFLAALIGSLGGVFVYLAAKRSTSDRIALLSALLFLFYPESILFGASQMREPFLMTFIAMAFYGLVEWQSFRQTSEVSKTSDVYLPWLWMALALAGMLFISPGFVLVSLVAAAGWLYFSDSGRKIPWQVIATAAGVFLVAFVALSLSWDSLVAAKSGGIMGVVGSWARETAKWNKYVLGRSSGIVQLLFEALPPALATPFVAIYGILQPVLPAALIEPAAPFWQVLGIIRALGWYLLLPFVAFAPFVAGKMPAGQSKRRWVWLSVVVWAWILIAAVRGGGDQWDNPRYRVILLAWQAMLAAQAFFALKSAARWFWRIVAVEAIILVTFGHWYLYRYLGIGFNLGIRNTLAIAIGLAVMLVAGDWLWEKHKTRKA